MSTAYTTLGIKYDANELYPLSRTQEILVAPFFQTAMILVPCPTDTGIFSTHVIGHLVAESLVLC